MLKNKLIEDKFNKKKFDLHQELENAVTIYNNMRHSSTGYPPIKVFNSKDDKLFNIIKKNNVKSQKYKIKPEIQLNNRKALLCENFELSGTKLKGLKFRSKGRYLIPITIIKNSSSKEYIISLPLDYKKLKQNKKYHVDYNLVKLCNEKTWFYLLNMQNNKLK